MTVQEELINLLKEDPRIIITEPMNDEMKKQVLKHEMERLNEIVPFVNEGMSDAFEEENALVLVMDNEVEITRTKEPSEDDGSFTLRTESGTIIGETITDEEELEELREDPTVYFLSENFVTYKNMAAPGEKQFFVMTGTHSNFFTDLDLESLVSSLIVAIPSTNTDHYIKDCYDLPHDTKLGTLIIGYTE